MKKHILLRYGVQMALSFLCLLYMGVSAQAQSGKPSETMTLLLDNSRPGVNHALLGRLAGSWSFQDAKLVFVKGTLVRKAIFNGRFYSVEITGGKLQVPVADGQMKEEAYQSKQIEGYDNPKMQFTCTSINNHIGSDIQFQSGTFNPAKNAFTYEWVDELIKGQPQQNRRVLTIKDASHYTEEFFELQKGAYVKVRELDYTKTGD